MARKSRKGLADAAPVREEEEAPVSVLETPKKPRTRRKKNAAAETATPAQEDAATAATEAETTPRKQPTRSAKKRKLQSGAAQQVDVSGAESDLTPLEDGDDDESPKKTRKAKKPRPPKPEPVYVIPNVQTLHTTFKGRLGYGARILAAAWV